MSRHYIQLEPKDPNSHRKTFRVVTGVKITDDGVLSEPVASGLSFKAAMDLVKSFNSAIKSELKGFAQNARDNLNHPGF